MSHPTVETELLAPYARATEASAAIWPAIGILAGVLFASFHFESQVVRAGAVGVYMLGVVVAVVVGARRSGVQPRFATMPAPLKRNLYAFWAGSMLLAVVALGVGFAVNFLVAALFIGVAFTVFGSWYHHRSRTIVTELSGRTGDVRA